MAGGDDEKLQEDVPTERLQKGTSGGSGAQQGNTYGFDSLSDSEDAEWASEEDGGWESADDDDSERAVKPLSYRQFWSLERVLAAAGGDHY